MPAARPYVLAETTWQAVRTTDYSLAILPWGATEPHNYHLPYATDILQCDYIAAEAARKAWAAEARCIVLPTVPFGVNTGHLDLPLTVNLNPTTQLAILRDVVASLAGQGFRKLLLLNGHGGNNFKPLLRQLQAEYPPFRCFLLDWFRFLDNAAFFDEPGDHAGEMETSNLLHLHPEWVRPLDEAGPGTATPFRAEALRSGRVWTPRHWRSATADTGVGNPAAATADRGRRFLDTLTTEISRCLCDLAHADPDDLYDADSPR